MTHPLQPNQDIKVSQEGSILCVTLCRGKANAIDNETSCQLGKIFQAFRDDDSLRIAIITAEGEKFFCAGWDLKAAHHEGQAPDDDYGVGGFGGLQELKNLNKPVIAAINGMAIGGGFEIMISADIILAAEHVRLALPEINVGVLADAATIKLRRRVPYHVAMEFLLTGRFMEAQEAKHWGLVNEICTADNLLPRAYEIARLLAEGPPLVFSAIKDVMRHTETTPEQQAFEILNSLSSVQKIYDSEDLKEGTRAFSEKRKPVWKGR